MAYLPMLLDLANRHYRVHLRVFSVCAIIALVLILVFGQWWLFWPTMVWSLFFGVHFLTYKSLNIDNDWIDERIARTTDKAYDVSHIENIRDSFDSEHTRAGKKGGDEAPPRRTPDVGSDKDSKDVQAP